MKIKAILFALTLSAASVFGQGLVTFQNSGVSTPIKVDTTGGTTYVNIPAGGNAYSFFFKYGSSLQFTSQTYFNSDTAAGRITTTGTQDITVANAPGGTPTQFQLFAYSTSAGSFANAQGQLGASWYQSAAITSTPSTTPTPGVPLFGPGVGTQFQGFNFITNVPEPTTVALGLLGAGSLLFLRRKK